MQTYRLIAIYALLLTGNACAWLWAWALFAHHPVLIGTATLAYALGLRHAVDADHIVAIDNVTQIVRGLPRERAARFDLRRDVGHHVAAGAVAPLTTAVLSSVDAAHTGSASGLNSAVSRTGGLVATALLGAVLGASGANLIAQFHIAAIGGAVLAAVASLSAFLFVRG